MMLLRDSIVGIVLIIKVRLFHSLIVDGKWDYEQISVGDKVVLTP
jgi:hypothetical protein